LLHLVDDLFEALNTSQVDIFANSYTQTNVKVYLQAINLDPDFEPSSGLIQA
jgi:hypothetical protein